jgi:transposase
MEMMYGAIDIHKHVFQAAVFDAASGEVVEERFPASREHLAAWQKTWGGRLCSVAIEATSGWRWVVRELQQHGFDVQLADPGQAIALKGKRRRAKTDRLDARWLAMLLAKQMLPTAWIPPDEIQQLRDLTRLRLALSQDRTRWAQRLHAFLAHEGWPCARSRLLTAKGRLWVASLALDPHARSQTARLLRLIAALDEEIAELDSTLRRLARDDNRLRALQTIWGVGPILACHLLAEIGDTHRFRRARQLVRAAGLDPVVIESADNKRRGRLSKSGSPQLRWALVEAAHHACRHGSPDLELYQSVRARAGAQRATLTAARKIARRCFHTLNTAPTPVT